MKCCEFNLGVALLVAILVSTVPAGEASAQTNSVKRELTSGILASNWGHLSIETVQNAAEGGNVEAMLAMCERMSDSITNKWLCMAAEAGEPWAQCRLGWCYQRIQEQNRHQQMWMADAAKWYRRSADQDFPGGLYHLALCYETGNGALPDEAKALELMRRAADQNHWYALNDLARFYDKGIGEPRDENDRIVNLLRRAASKGQCDASVTLIGYYLEGSEIKRNLVMAAKQFVAAADWYPGFHVETAENPSPDARGHIDSFTNTIAFYIKAARLDRPEPMIQIADMYITGNDVPQDFGRAWVWLSIAGEHGGVVDLAAVEQKLTPEELKEAKKLLPVIVEDLKHADKIVRKAKRRVFMAD